MDTKASYGKGMLVERLTTQVGNGSDQVTYLDLDSLNACGTLAMYIYVWHTNIPTCIL